jgi:uroporphyrinogen decarboxylase
MKPREVVLEAFDLGEPERVPATIFGGGMWTVHNSGSTFLDLIADPEKYARVIIATAEKLRSDIVYVGSGYNNFLAAALGGKIKIRVIGAPDLEAPLINTPEDLDDLRPENIDGDTVINNIREATRIVNKEIGREYLVTTTCWGPFTKAANLRGVEALMRDIFKNPDFTRRVVDFSAGLLERFYEPLIEDGTLSVISVADPTASGDLISKKQFVDFALPALQKFVRNMKKKGVKTLLHICGNTSDKLHEIASSRAACFSLDHKVDLARAKEELKGKICIAGNVNPVAVLNNGTPAEIRRVAQDCIAMAAEGGGYVLMPGCDIPPTVPLENIQSFIDAARKPGG